MIGNFLVANSQFETFFGLGGESGIRDNNLIDDLTFKTYYNNEKIIKSLGITVKDENQSNGVTVTKVENDEINLTSGDIILEVNREVVDSMKSFTSLVEKYEETGRSSLLLKIQRGEETSWVTIKFVDS